MNIWTLDGKKFEILDRLAYSNDIIMFVPIEKYVFVLLADLQWKILSADFREIKQGTLTASERRLSEVTWAVRGSLIVASIFSDVVTIIRISKSRTIVDVVSHNAQILAENLWVGKIRQI